MFIVYLLTNLDKDTFPNKYIGSKGECKIVELEGIPTIIDNNSGKPYKGSSKNPIMQEEIARGDRFSAKVLHVVRRSDKKDLRRMEDYYLKLYDVANSEEYYNLTDNAVVPTASSIQDRVLNEFGETSKEVAKQNSSMAKRDNRAKFAGFNNYGLLYLYFYEEVQKGRKPIDISLSLGLERHFASRYMREFNMEKAYKECTERTDIIDTVRDLWWRGATLGKIAELTGLEKVTARYFLGDYAYNKNFGVSRRLKMSKEELEVEITRRILDGDSFHKVCNDLGVCLESVKRYFFRCVRRHLKSSDLRVI